jgi:hypothetical protein
MTRVALSETTPVQLPIIDISNPNDVSVGKKMLDAAVEFGFFYVKSESTNFTVADVDRAFELVCFLLSRADKTRKCIHCYVR